MSKTRSWLDGYVRAWKSKNPADVRAIFTDDAEYWFRPDDDSPVRGIDAIVRMWAEESEPTEPVIDLDVLVEDEHVGVVTGSVVPTDFRAVGQFYADFRQVEDDEVVALLRESGAMER